MKFLTSFKTTLLLTLLKFYKYHNAILPFVNRSLESLHSNNKQWTNAKTIQSQIINGDWKADLQPDIIDKKKIHLYTLSNINNGNQLWVGKNAIKPYQDYSSNRKGSLRLIDTLGVFSSYVHILGFKDIIQRAILILENVNDTESLIKKDNEYLKNHIDYS